MAYIPPNSTVQYFSDLGLSRDDTLYFGSVSSKNTYFANLTKIASEESLTYVSREKGVIRSSLPMSTAINIGYMRYKNTSFENFWFYAFVTNVEYTNNGLTEIHFEIDNMMTYMGVFTLGECFVERQHVTNDTIGANLCDENLAFGDYKYRAVSKTGDMQNAVCVVLSTITADGETPATSSAAGGIYNGCALFSLSSQEAVDTYIKKLTDNAKSDAIISLCMMPALFATQNLNHKEYSFDKPYTDIDGYTPKNNKLFIYPYNYITVYNSDGNFADFRYEFFSGTKAAFSAEGLISPNPEIVLTPVFYKGSGSTYNYAEKIVLSGFPSCAYSVDSYKAFLAQERSNVAVSVMSAVNTETMRSISAAAQVAGAAIPAIGATLGGIGGAAAGLAVGNTVGNTMSELYRYSQKPPHAGGSQGNSVVYSAGGKDFFFLQKNITRNYAEMIDNYFDLFGYAVRQHLTPNMNARPNWTYCKTIGCIVHGNMPSSAARDIESMFDNGVRFWKNHNNIGNYSLNNAPA